MLSSRNLQTVNQIIQMKHIKTVWLAPKGAKVIVDKKPRRFPAGNIHALAYGYLAMRIEGGFVNLNRIRMVVPPPRPLNPKRKS